MTRAFEGTKTVNIDGTTLAYEEKGDCAPVVFVHGAISDLRTWYEQLFPIGESYRAIAYSRRYARPNEDIESNADDPILRHVDDLATFLRAINAAPAHLVGNSWGGFISLLTALRYPEIVRSLVLEEAAIAPLLRVSIPPRPSQRSSLSSFGVRGRYSPSCRAVRLRSWRESRGRSKEATTRRRF